METTGLEKDPTKALSFWDILPNILKFLPRVPKLIKALRELGDMASDKAISIGRYLEQNAKDFPDSNALLFEDVSYTHKEFNEQINRYAHYLLSQGVKKGDVVVAFLDNRPEILFLIGGVAKIGAIVSLINSHHRGPVLMHSINTARDRIFIIGEELIDPFEEVKEDLQLGPDTGLYFLKDRGQAAAPEGWLDWDTEIKDADSSNPTITTEILSEDPFAYLFTSGTTGMPKAAITVHGRWITPMKVFGRVMFNLSPKDTVYIPLPFYHGTAMYVGWPSAAAGGAAVAMRRKFSKSNFWKDVEKFNATAFIYIGELCRYLMQQPESPDDAKNTIKKIIGNGLRVDIWKAFKARFDIAEIYEFYGSSEGNIAFTNMLNLDCTVGWCPIPHAIVKYDIDQDTPILDADGFMQKVEKGEAGLLIGHITEEAPFVGYTDENATESKILRDVFEKGDAWFDTGDLMRDIGFKHAQFVDRLGDTFRWKGENVSTTEVEAVINSFDQVSGSSVFGAAIPGADGRAGMAAIVSDRKIEKFDLQGLAAVIQKGLPAYAWPIFIRFKSELEVTHTFKLKKSVLKKEAFSLPEIEDPLFVRLPGETEYTPVTETVYKKIMDGGYSF
jgi:citronellyl-CoA synthetase